MQRNTSNTINRDFIFSAEFIARKSASVRRHRIFREVMLLTAVICGVALLFDAVLRYAGA